MDATAANPPRARFSERFVRRDWTPWLVALGLGLRAYHYLRGPSLWHDEAALVVNVLDKSFAELLGPLFFAEAAPPLFLWLEKAASLLFGDGLYALRLPPFLASCAALLLLVPVARRWLPAAAVPWAVLFFACSDRLLWHACEAKQYAGEALAALVLMALYCRTESWPSARRSLAFAALAPAVLFTSYPGCFLYGGVLLALLPGAWRSRRPAAWLSYATLAAVVFGCFALLFAGPMRAQRNETIVECWQGMQQFPDWRRPWSVPGWMFQSQLDLVAHVIDPLGRFLAPLAIVGAVGFWRRKMFAELTLLLTPIALAFGASCFEAYPYGGIRVMIYAAPAIVLLVAAGIAPCAAWLESRGRFAAGGLAAIVLAPVAAAAVHVAVPWQRADCGSAADFVQQRRLSEDPVIANHWEYRYYFRELGAAFTPLEEFTPRGRSRLWLVVTASTSADRDACLAAYTSKPWRVLQRKEFFRTTVVLVEPRVDVGRR
jgi:hypothetical protein